MTSVVTMATPSLQTHLPLIDKLIEMPLSEVTAQSTFICKELLRVSEVEQRITTWLHCKILFNTT